MADSFTIEVMTVKSEIEVFQRTQHWRFYWDWLLAVVPIVGAIYICEKISFGLYPIALLVIGNRYNRLATLGHEGLHGLISKVPWWNSFLGRYLCHFPAFTSHSRYKSLHALHHRFLGEKMDPDNYLFLEFPEPLSVWIKRILFDMLTFKIVFDFLDYYSEIPDRIRRALGRKPKFGANLTIYKSDFWQYCTYWLLIFCGIHLLQGWPYFFLYWILPAYLHTPIIQLINGGLQHGAMTGETKSRTLMGPTWLMEAFIPLDLNFHYEHHLNPRVPHYNLRAFASYLKDRELAPVPHRTTPREAFAAIFPSFWPPKRRT